MPISWKLLKCADESSETPAAVCLLEALEAVKALVAHDVLIARSLSQETVGVVIALCAKGSGMYDDFGGWWHG